MTLAKMHAALETFAPETERERKLVNALKTAMDHVCDSSRGETGPQCQPGSEHCPYCRWAAEAVTDVLGKPASLPKPHLPARGQVWRRHLDGGKFVVWDEVQAAAIASTPDYYDYVTDTAHADGDYSYVCRFLHCKCQP